MVHLASFLLLATAIGTALLATIAAYALLRQQAAGGAAIRRLPFNGRIGVQLAVAATIYRRRWRLIAMSWVMVLGGGKLVELLLKQIFPILLRIHRPLARMAITAAAGLLILAVGVSRLVLGLHYFTDVVGGYAAGGMWLALSIAALEAERRRWYIESPAGNVAGS